MEEASNGKIEERQEVIEEVEVVGSGAKLAREVVIDSTSELVKESLDESISSLDGSNGSNEEAEAKEKNAQVEEAGILEVVEKEVVDTAVGSTEFVVFVVEKLTETIEASVEKLENSEVVEKEVVDTAVGSTEFVVFVVEKLTETIEASVEKLENSDVVEEEVKEIKEKVSVHLNETDVIPPAVTDQTDGELPEVVLNATDGSFPAVTEVVSEKVEEKVLQSHEESNAATPALTDAESKGSEEVKQAALEENIGESSINVDRETVESVESTTVVGSSDAFPETTRTPPIISLRHRSLRPSWKSCCGLFEALRPSDK